VAATGSGMSLADWSRGKAWLLAVTWSHSAAGRRRSVAGLQPSVISPESNSVTICPPRRLRLFGLSARLREIAQGQRPWEVQSVVTWRTWYLRSATDRRCDARDLGRVITMTRWQLLAAAGLCMTTVHLGRAAGAPTGRRRRITSSIVPTIVWRRCQAWPSVVRCDAQSASAASGARVRRRGAGGGSARLRALRSLSALANLAD
jgi:hypothetical protein